MSARTINQMVREFEQVLGQTRSGNPFLDATRELGPCVVMEPQAFAATFFPPHHDDHIKCWHLERKLAASAHITTEMLLADLRREREVA